MDKKKQIDEMAEAIFLNCHAGLFEDEARMIAKFCYQEIERKSSDVAREIFEEIESLLNVYINNLELNEWTRGMVGAIKRYLLAELKNKYTEDGK